MNPRDLGSVSPAYKPISLSGHRWWVRYIGFGSGGRTMYSVSKARLLAWSLTDLSHPRMIANSSLSLRRGGWIDCAVLSPGGEALVTAIESRVVIWNVERLKRVRPTAILDARNLVTSVAFSPNGRVLAVADVSRQMTLWETSDIFAPIKLASVEDRPPDRGDVVEVRSVVAFSPDGRTLAIGGWGRSVSLWDVTRSVRPVALSSLPSVHGDGVYGISFSPDGRTLATCASGPTVGMTEIWDIDDRGLPSRLAGIRSPAGSYAAFSPDGNWLAAGGPEANRVLWDLRNLRQPVPVDMSMPHTGYMADVAFSPDGHFLATTHGAGRDFRIMLWPLQ
jgi:WD40 repeat protein